MSKNDDILSAMLETAAPVTEAAESTDAPAKVEQKETPNDSDQALLDALDSDAASDDADSSHDEDAGGGSDETDDRDSAEDDRAQSDEDEDELKTQDDQDDQDKSTDNEQESSDTDYLDVSDDDLIEVKIDGEVVYKPLRELKEALSAEGAIQKRLKDATEARKLAQAERSQGTVALEDSRVKLIRAVDQLQSQLFPPMVAKPDEALRLSNPQAFLEQESMFRQDQDRIVSNKQQLAVSIQQQNEAHTTAMNEWRQSEAQELARKVPAFSDPAQSKAAVESIVKVAEHYGVSQQELAELGDHRLFHMAHDAGKYLRLLEKAALTTPEQEVKAVKKRNPRRLRSGVAQRKYAASQTSKQKRSLTDRARKSGKVEDVAATLLRPAE